MTALFVGSSVAAGALATLARFEFEVEVPAAVALLLEPGAARADQAPVRFAVVVEHRFAIFADLISKEYARQTGRKRKITALQIGYEARCAKRSTQTLRTAPAGTP